MAANGVDALFTRVLEAHTDPNKVNVTQSQQDRMFPVQSSSLDEPFFMEIAAVLSSDQQSRRQRANKPHGEAPGPQNFGAVQKKLRGAMRRFIDNTRPVGVGYHAVITASLGVLRRSCATTVPVHVSNIAANVLLTAMENIACSARAPVTGNVTSQLWQPGSSGSRYQQQQQQQPACSPWRGPLELGGDNFPEAHMAAFLGDATVRIHGRGESDDAMTPNGSNVPPAIRLSAKLASKVICTFGVGAPVPDHRLQWGRNPDVAESLKMAARRVADKLRQEGDWSTLANLLGEMATWRGATEAEVVLGIELREVIASAMLSGKWEAARRAVSAAADGEPRRELARALIPSASDAYAFSVAKALIEENSLEKEFPELKEMERKRRLMAVVKKPGWKMAQRMLERGAKNEPQLRVWLTRYLIEEGDLPAAAQLMDHFKLHHVLPPLDPGEVEACARENAARHLQIPLADSRVFLVDGWDSLLYSERALAMPPKVVGKDEGQGRGTPGAYCVGLDVESTVQESHATLLQVASSSEVFLFDLPGLCGGRNDHRGYPGSAAGAGPKPGELRRRFDDLIAALLANPSIVKLGFAFDRDLSNLRKCWPEVRGFRRLDSLLEIGQVSNRVLGEEHPSLSKTCEAWLGKPLDKTECASDWGHRPLTVDQVRYAALDAHCLVGIFEEMLLVNGGKLAGTGESTVNGWWKQFLKGIS